MQSKGIVMQISNGQAVVMTKECQFQKIPFLEGMRVGQEVEFPAEDVLTPLTTKKGKQAWYAKPWRKTGLVAASVLLAVGLWGGQSFVTGTPAYAYVTVDINPSVELSIDKKQQVLSAMALNDEAKDVLNGLKLKGLGVKEAVETLAQTAQEKGFFQEKTEVIVTASAAVDEEKLKQSSVDLVKLEDDLVSKLKMVAVEQNPGVEVEGILVSKDVREAAKQAGVSPGKYAFYLNATSNGIDVDLEELKNNPIHKVVDQRPQMASVVHEMQGGDHLDELLKMLKEQGKPSLLNFSNKAKGIVPSKEDSKDQQDDDNKKSSPGQGKKDDKKVQTPTSQKSTNTKSSDHDDHNKSGNANNHSKNQPDKKQPTPAPGKDSKNDKNDDKKKNNEQDNKGNNNNNNSNNDKGHYSLPIR